MEVGRWQLSSAEKECQWTLPILWRGWTYSCPAKGQVCITVGNQIHELVSFEDFRADSELLDIKLACQLCIRLSRLGHWMVTP